MNNRSKSCWGDEYVERPLDDDCRFDYDPPEQPFDFATEYRKHIDLYRAKAGLPPIGEPFATETTKEATV